MMLRTCVIAAALPVLGCIAMLVGEASAQQPSWSRAGSVLDKSCAPTAPKLSSPGRHITAEVRCSSHNGGVPAYSLRLHAGRKQVAEFALPAGATEIVWSPDSHWFFLNGEELPDLGVFVKLYSIDEQAGVREHDVTSLAQRDMVEAFPPCKAANHDDECRRIESNPQFNISALGFTPDSKIIFLFAEIPCTSEYGGIKCQIRGYEIDLASGQILQRLSAQQVQLHWQRMAMWDITVPDPPVYDAPQ
jgi:hypothetical protein